MNTISIEEILFPIIDQCKFLFFPEQWNHIFSDCSKNEVFALLLVYRRNQVNMTEISEYMNIPLNTVTGIVSRLEKKELVLRQRNKDDKRVVSLSLTDSGKKMMKDEINFFSEYFELIMEALSEEERSSLFSILEKLFKALTEKKKSAVLGNTEKRVKRIIIE